MGMFPRGEEVAAEKQGWAGEGQDLRPVVQGWELWGEEVQGQRKVGRVSGQVETPGE